MRCFLYFYETLFCVGYATWVLASTIFIVEAWLEGFHGDKKMVSSKWIHEFLYPLSSLHLSDTIWKTSACFASTKFHLFLPFYSFFTVIFTSKKPICFEAQLIVV